MNELKLIRILRTLNPAELKDFEKFIVSPYFNKGRNLQPYFRELKKFYPEFDSPKLTKEYIYSRLSKGAKFDGRANSLMNKLNSELQKLMEYFLVTVKLELNQVTRSILLNEMYLQKGLHKISLSELLKLKNDLYGKGISDTYYQPQQKVLGLTAEAYIGTGHMKEFHNTYKEFSDSVLLYMLTFYFEDYAHRKNFEIGSNYIIKPSPAAKILSELNFKEIIENIEKKNRINGIKANIYYHLYLCYKEPAKYSVFNSFKTLLFRNLDLFGHEEKYNLLNYLYTLCYISERLGSGNREKDRFEIIKIKTERKILSFRENEIHHTTYDGIVSLYLSNKKYTEAENFITEFTDWLPMELRERYRKMAMARLYFNKQEFGKVLEILSTKQELTLNNISAVQLKLISLFELKEYDAAVALIESFKKYLKNNKTISKANGNHYLGFAEGLQILIKNITGSGETEPLMKMKNVIKKYPSLFRKNWLLKKAEELESAGAGKK